LKAGPLDGILLEQKKKKERLIPQRKQIREALVVTGKSQHYRAKELNNNNDERERWCPKGVETEDRKWTVVF